MAIKQSMLVKVKRDNDTKLIPVRELNIGDYILSYTSKPTFKKVVDLYECRVDKNNQRHVSFNDGNILSCDNSQFIFEPHDDMIRDVEIDELLVDNMIFTDGEPIKAATVKSNGNTRSKYVNVFVDDSSCFFCTSKYNTGMFLLHS